MRIGKKELGKIIKKENTKKPTGRNSKKIPECRRTRAIMSELNILARENPSLKALFGSLKKELGPLSPKNVLKWVEKTESIITFYKGLSKKAVNENNSIQRQRNEKKLLATEIFLATLMYYNAHVKKIRE